MPLLTKYKRQTLFLSGYSTNRPDDDFDLHQSDTVDREWRRQYKKQRATVAEQHRTNRNSLY